MATRFRERLFGGWARFVSAHPWLIVIVAGVLAAACAYYSVTHFRYQSNRNLLISDKLEWNRRFIDVQRRFPGNSDVIVIIDAGADASTPGSPAYLEARAVVDELGPKLRASPHVAEAVWGANFSPRALRIAPIDEFKRRVAQMEEAKPMLASPTPQALMANVVSELRSNQGRENVDEKELARSLGEFNQLIKAMGAVLAQPADAKIDFAALATPGESTSTWSYLPSDNGRLLFMRISPRLNSEALDALTPALNDIRPIIAAAQAKHPKVEIGVTGIEVMEADETEVTTWDSTWTGALAAVLILTLLIIAYHSWQTPLFAMIALLIGIAWSYGFLFLVVGHLQVLSVVFNIMLLGLGIAYCIYLASAFELLRHQYPDNVEGFTQAMAKTLQIMGPGVLTGALTTAASFGTTIFTDFTGVAEMGLIAGVGILLCFIAVFSVFPALLRIFKPTHAHIASMENRRIHFFEERWVMPFVRHPAATLIIAGVLSAGALYAVLQMRFDFDLLKLQPRNSPSMKWAERIVRDGGQSIWYGLSITDSLEEAKKLSDEFRKQPTIGRVGGVGLLFPTDDAERVAILTQARAKLGPALDAATSETAATRPATAPATQAATTAPTTQAAATAPAATATATPLPGDFIQQLGAMQFLLQFAGGNAPPSLREPLTNLGATMRDIVAQGAKLSPEERSARLQHLNQLYADWRRDNAKQIALATDPSPMRFEDLPYEIMRSYRDDEGRYAIEVYPDPQKKFPGSNITSPLDPRFLPDFTADLTKVDPNATGVVMQIYRSGLLIEHAYERAGLIALVLVFVVVLIDYRSLHDAMLIMLPVAMAFGITFAIMWLAGMKVNAANIIVLPLMFGIGVDSGVHVLNRYRQNPADNPVGLTRGTGKGITITCLTSVISFAVMMLSSHRGIASLGFVLAVGLLMTMLACWTVMPAWLELRRRFKLKRGQTLEVTR